MKHLFMTLVSTLGLLSSTTGEEAIPLLAPKAFQAAFQADSTAVILDVRRPSEFAEGHLKGAILLDWLSDKAFVEGLAKLDKSRTHYVYCRRGHRSHAGAASSYVRGLPQCVCVGWGPRAPQCGAGVEPHPLQQGSRAGEACCRPSWGGVSLY